MPLILDDLYSEIASAIRTKESKEEDIKAADFAERIRALQTKSNFSMYPILVTTAPTATVTATQDDVEVSAVTDSSGKALLWVPSAGTWNIVASKASYTSTPTQLTIQERVHLYELGIYLYTDGLTTGGPYTYIGTETFDDKAFLGGGYCGSAFDIVSVYDESLTRTETNLSIGRYDIYPTSLDYIMFPGGQHDSGPSNAIDVFDPSLTRSIITLSLARFNTGSASVGDYSVLAGGYASVPSNVVDCISRTLTRSTLANLTANLHEIGAGELANNIIFAGGHTGSQCVTTVFTYDSSLSRSTLTSLSSPTCTRMVELGDIIIGFHHTSTNVWSWNNDLVLTECEPLSLSKGHAGAVRVSNCALNVGGEINNSYQGISEIEIYDDNLTKMPSKQLPEGRYNLNGVSVKDYGLILGGRSGNTVKDIKTDGWAFAKRV